MFVVKSKLEEFIPPQKVGLNINHYDSHRVEHFSKEVTAWGRGGGQIRGCKTFEPIKKALLARTIVPWTFCRRIKINQKDEH